MENSGKQNPEMGFKSPPSTWLKSIPVLSGLYLDTYDNTSFYLKRNTLNFFIFLVVKTTKSQNRVKSCHSPRGPFFALFAHRHW